MEVRRDERRGALWGLLVGGVTIGGERHLNVSSRRIRVRAHLMRGGGDLDRLLGVGRPRGRMAV